MCSDIAHDISVIFLIIRFAITQAENGVPGILQWAARLSVRLFQDLQLREDPLGIPGGKLP